MATKSVKKTTKKVAKKVTKPVAKAKKADLSKNLNKIKDTAMTLNAQVLDTAGDVVEVIVANGTQLSNEATKTAKKTYNKVNKEATKTVKETYAKVNKVVSVENIKGAAKSVNSYTLKTADELVDGAISNGEKLTVIAEKAVKGGLKLAAKQNDIVFDTLETVKDQLAGSAVRFRKLFSRN